jgi:dipeptidyl aminopeptidase/acylaminoacyl peptidase
MILMRSRLVLVFFTTVVLVTVLNACGSSFSDPETAVCDNPAATFGDPHILSDYQEIEVHFTCEGVTLAGTLTLPLDPGPHPALVWVHGSGEEGRLTYKAPLVQKLVQTGLAVFSYDKRGVGESQGVCCPGDSNHFNLLAADVAGAVNALRSRSDIDPKQIGLLGASQAGWIVPLSVARFDHVAFIALVDAPVVTTGEEGLYSRLTGEEGGQASGLSKEEIAQRLKQAGPSGFDPVPFLKQIKVPGLWLYGGEDLSQPVDSDLIILDQLKAEGKDITSVVFPSAGHGLLDVPPTDPKALPILIEWLLKQVHVPNQ